MQFSSSAHCWYPSAVGFQMCCCPKSSENKNLCPKTCNCESVNSFHTLEEQLKNLDAQPEFLFPPSSGVVFFTRRENVLKGLLHYWLILWTIAQKIWQDIVSCLCNSSFMEFCWVHKTDLSIFQFCRLLIFLKFKLHSPRLLPVTTTSHQPNRVLYCIFASTHSSDSVSG